MLEPRANVSEPRAVATGSGKWLLNLLAAWSKGPNDWRYRLELIRSLPLAVLTLRGDTTRRFGNRPAFPKGNETM